MLVLTPNPAYGAFSVRPLDAAVDKAVVRELFRQEFYGDSPKQYSDEGLWEIYERFDTHDVFGAYLVYENDTLLFLLEVHPSIQMDLVGEYLLKKDYIGIYCFVQSPAATANLPALRACMDSLLNYPGINRIITALGHAALNTTKAILLEKAGFQKLPVSTERLSIYQCTHSSIISGSSPVSPS